MVAITGQVPSNLLGRDIFQEVDITGTVAAFSKHSYLVKDAARLPQIVKEAFYIASTAVPARCSSISRWTFRSRRLRM